GGVEAVAPRHGAPARPPLHPRPPRRPRAHHAARGRSVLPRLRQEARMTRIVVTSAVRHAGHEAFSGYVRIVDLDSDTVTHVEPVPESPWRDVDPNPRGGTRGAKGVSTCGDRLVLCNSDSVFVLDERLAAVATFSHPLAGAIHDVLAGESGI